MVLLSRFFDWREALVIVKPETFIKWHRAAFRLFWKWKCRKSGRPRLPKKLQELIRQMAHDNPTWGEERIANELRLKLGIRVSPRTVGKYFKRERPNGGNKDQRWTSFVRNQAKVIVACDFFVSVSLTFRCLYVFVAMEIGSRRILHCNVTAHPTAEWTTQAIPRGFRRCASLPVCHSRSRFDLFGFAGCGAERFRVADLKNASTSSHGECLLRTARWHDSPGVSGLSHSDERTALEPDSERIRCLLQSSTPPFCSPWNAGAHSAECRDQQP
jgi:hypothetical protein